MIDRHHELPVIKQVRLLQLSRSSLYYVSRPLSDGDLALMRRIDEMHLKYPFAGARMLRDMLRLQGEQVGRKKWPHSFGQIFCKDKWILCS